MTTMFVFMGGFVLLAIASQIWWSNLGKLTRQADPDCEAPLLAEELGQDQLTGPSPIAPCSRCLLQAFVLPASSSRIDSPAVSST